jgi:sensor c-di-GMP phosphodiesterase-like protein
MIDFEAIRSGLNNGEFFLEYLPTISLDDGHCVGAEALIRWRRESGIVPPDQFIPVAENTPLSGLITYWVVEKVGEELGDWLRENDDVYVSINVPPEVLGRGGLEYSATKSGLSDLRSKIVLEVTERGIPDKLGVEALEYAALSGVRVALDDVNVSGANMVVLSRCHVEILKLDKSLVDQVSAGEQPVWLATVARLLETTDFHVIAEGIETADQRDVIQAAGIKMAQGFFFSRPLSAQAFVAFHEQHRGVNRPAVAAASSMES